jgi:hypothetical protein
MECAFAFRAVEHVRKSGLIIFTAYVPLTEPLTCPPGHAEFGIRLLWATRCRGRPSRGDDGLKSPLRAGRSLSVEPRQLT